MRQLWYAGIALVAGLSLAACDNSPTKQETKQEPPKTETTKTAAAPTATPPAAPAPVAAKPAAPPTPAPAAAPAAPPPAAPAPVAAKPAAPPAPAPAAAPAAEAAKVAAAPAPAAAPAATAKVVKIAIAGPLTGANAAFGAQIKNGSEQAAEDINAAGGILGHKIELLYGDDVSDPKQGVSIANKFAGDGAKLVVGHFNSGVSIPSSDVYAENGMLQITPASTNPTFTERSMWNVFRTCGRDDQQGTVAGNYIAEVLKGKKVAVVHDKTTYGKGLADETKKAMNAKGVTEVLYEGVNTGEKDFSALISKIKESGAEIVYWGGLHTEGGLIVRQMRDAAVTATLMGADGIATDEFAAVAGPGAEGTLMTFAPDPQKRPEAAPVLAKFEARKFKPESYTLYSYAAMQILKTAAERAGKIDPKTMAAVMHSGEPFKTVIGDIGYDKKGDITRLDYVMYTWKKQADGRITFVQNP